MTKEEVSKKIQRQEKLHLLLKYALKCWKNNPKLRLKWTKGTTEHEGFKLFWIATRKDIENAIKHKYDVMFDAEFTKFSIINPRQPSKKKKVKIKEDDVFNAKIASKIIKKQQREFEEKLANGDLPLPVILNEYFHRTGKHFIPPEQYYGDHDVSRSIIYMYDVLVTWDGLKRRGFMVFNDKTFKPREYLKL